MPENHGHLSIELQGNLLRTVALSLGRTTIGRTPDNTVVLASPLVSSRHAEIEVTTEGAIITDLGSQQGTFVSGKRVLPNQPTPLTDGTVLQIGLFLITFTGAPVSDEKPKKGKPAPDPVPDEPETPPIPIPPAPPPPPPRPTQPLAPAVGPQSVYLENLPVIFHDQDFLGRYLLIFQTLWEPLEWRQDHLEMYFDPLTAPVGFLRWLEQWLGIAANQHWPESRRRRFMVEAMDLYRWRGTPSGLRRMIEICTGLNPSIEERAPFVFTVTLTKNDRAQQELLETLIQTHKPAHAGFLLEFK